MDYREQIETYFMEVAYHAEAKQPGSIETAKTHDSSESQIDTRFHYIDTNAYRNGTKGIEKRIEDEIVAVVGVGGSGSYLVDVLAKTNVKELHLFDADTMETHNAFRVAGAARIAELGGNTSKVAWHERRYREVRKEGLHVHCIELTDDTLSRLGSFTTVFIAVDDLPVRRKLQRACSSMGILHLAVGIGLDIEGMGNDQLGGNVKVEINYLTRREDTYGSPQGEPRPEGEDIYRSNIQTAELNMLSAALAIAEWKAVRQVYRSERAVDIDTLIYSSTTGKILGARKGASNGRPSESVGDGSHS
ncbi:MAG: ThiF family adenylyltransferase [Chloroflexota bacterium]|nr:ThiF family adenylyltransferase [Chloroflexota bacterium]